MAFTWKWVICLQCNQLKERYHESCKIREVDWQNLTANCTHIHMHIDTHTNTDIPHWNTLNCLIGCSEHWGQTQTQAWSVEFIWDTIKVFGNHGDICFFKGLHSRTSFFQSLHFQTCESCDQKAGTHTGKILRFSQSSPLASCLLTTFGFSCFLTLSSL